MPERFRGFTLVELMITLVIIAICVMLAVPSYKEFIEKRQMTAAAENVASFIEFARHEAVKRNEKVWVQWHSPGGHNPNWCIGLSMAPKNTPCDCRETDPANDAFCSIDGVPHRMVQTDYVDIGFEFMHMNPISSSFSFNPVRGVVDDIADPESADGDWLMYLHSNEGSGSTRRWELEISLNPTGRTSICSDVANRIGKIGGYPEC